MEKKEKSFFEEYKSGMTLKSFIVGIVLVILLVIYGNIAGGFSRDPAMRDLVCDYAEYTFLVMFILAVVSPPLKKAGFTVNELVVIYTMVGGSLMMIAVPQVGDVANWPLYLLLQSPHPIAQITPSIWLPSSSVVEPMLMGGAPVPWGAWTIPLTFWILLILSIMGFVASFGLILSHKIINVERLPYPWAQMMMAMIEKPEKPLQEKIAVKSLIVGFVIGFFIGGSFDLFPDIIPGFPRFWPIGTAGVYRIDFGPLIGPATSNMSVWFPVYRIAFLAPLFFFSTTKILGSALLTHIVVWMLIPFVQVKMGIMTNICAFGLYDATPTYITYFGTVLEPSPLQVISFASVGFMLGVTLTYIVLSGKDIAGSFKSAIRGEKIGQISDRAAWLGFIGSIILFLVLTSLSEIPVHVGLFIIVVSLLIAHAWQRARGYSTLDRTDFSQHVGPAVFPDMVTMLLGGEASRGTTASYASQIIVGESICGYITVPISYVVFDGLRLCELTKTKWGDVVKSGVIAAIVAVIVGFIVMIWGGYTWGYQASFPGFWFGASSWASVNIANYQFTPGTHVLAGVIPTRVFPDMVAGIIVSAIITVLSYYFPWFPVHPIGLIWGAQLLFPGTNVGAVLIAFIARVLVLRIGGVKLYEKAVPVAIGTILGAGISSLLYGFVLMTRVI